MSYNGILITKDDKAISSSLLSIPNRKLTDEEIKKHSDAIEMHLNLLVHVSKCSLGDNCETRHCSRMKDTMLHIKWCNIKAENNCIICKRIAKIMPIHAKRCNDDKCMVPKCSFFKSYTSSCPSLDFNGLNAQMLSHSLSCKECTLITKRKPLCNNMKQMLSHVEKCGKRDCDIYNRMVTIITSHVQKCQNNECSFYECSFIKKMLTCNSPCIAQTNNEILILNKLRHIKRCNDKFCTEQGCYLCRSVYNKIKASEQIIGNKRKF
jgi:hypothetical protein